MSDAETLAVYAAKASDYAQLVSRGQPDADLRAFMAALPAHARVLDLGCGPGNSARMMMDAGFDVEATDAAPEMVALARKAGVEARVATFADLEAIDRYDGIWANFSLLHAPRAAFSTHLQAIKRALKPGGLLHLGMKLGSGEGRDGLGRFYTYYSVEELENLLAQAGFRVAGKRFGEAAGLAGTSDPFVILTAHG
ncbi:class I SAM-dependent DNA methyltransferase [Pseudoruegeria sp. SHC-113]|uniref:class I SAM-dependent DNA methyltransferase n=1 Tax=Pseudoruegeria sp. SHC-113 TaxID=2855439 RepID=UPI0021BB486F|nr:class I SAM-dependent methyltransferase [Pseudoruegeria sp. SHC-113]MCT8159223.1 class I SAM-dependent methyltransferase [Pseudoruegeria sp. SHC-113]